MGKKSSVLDRLTDRRTRRGVESQRKMPYRYSVVLSQDILPLCFVASMWKLWCHWQTVDSAFVSQDRLSICFLIKHDSMRLLWCQWQTVDSALVSQDSLCICFVDSMRLLWCRWETVESAEMRKLEELNLNKRTNKRICLKR